VAMKKIKVADESQDLIFSCPPYHDLELYSDDERDLSNMEYTKFVMVYADIIRKTMQKLKPNRFACFVVSEIRDKNGIYKSFVHDTINCFKAADGQFYNDIILVNAIGTLPIRINKQFSMNRKVGKMHQNILVFYKGDVDKIKESFEKLDLNGYDQKDIFSF
jgi:DNA modification methylase